MSKVIYIEKHENVKDVAGHFKNVADKNLILVVPKQAEIFNNAENLKKLKREADAHGTCLTIITLDPIGQKSAEQAGIIVSKPKSGAKGDLEHPLLAQESSSEKHNNFLKDFWDSIVRKRKPSWQRYFGIAVVLVLVLIAGAAIWYVQAVKTEIVLKTNKQEFNSIINFSLDSKALDEREENGVLVEPARVVRKTMNMEDEFPATGNKIFGEKAVGTIQFYNFTEDTITLKGNETILKAGDLQFKLNTDILSIRPTAHIGLNNIKIDPTSLSAPQGIEAQDTGDAYNLPADTQFEVINSNVDISPELFYAQNNLNLSGGFIKEITVVDQKDAENAQEILRGRILEKALNALEKTLKRYEKIAQDKIELTATEYNVSPTVGSEASTFKLKIKVDVIGLAYNQRMLEDRLRDNIIESLPKGKKMVDGAKIINLSFKNIDLNTGQATAENIYRGFIYPILGIDDAKKVLRGKSEKEIIDYFKQKGVGSVRVQFTPMWLNRAPWLGSKIFIKVE